MRMVPEAFDGTIRAQSFYQLPQAPQADHRRAEAIAEVQRSEDEEMRIPNMTDLNLTVHRYQLRDGRRFASLRCAANSAELSLARVKPYPVTDTVSGAVYSRSDCFDAPMPKMGEFRGEGR